MAAERQNIPGNRKRYGRTMGDFMTITLKHRGQFLTVSGRLEGNWFEINSVEGENGEDLIYLADDIQVNANEQAMEDSISNAADREYDLRNGH